MQQKQTDLDQRIFDKAIPYFRLYQKMVLNLNKAQHHHTYLTTCIDTNLTPKGLQTRVAPQVPDQDFEFSIKWEQAHLDLSSSFIRFTRGLSSSFISFTQGLLSSFNSFTWDCHHILFALHGACHHLLLALHRDCHQFY